MNQKASGLLPGLVGSAEMTVGEANTALSMGSGQLAILATPALVALMEAAAQAAVAQYLLADQQTVGTHLDIRHEGATPVGMKVMANAELIAVEGRTLRFRVRARDEKEGISEGWHERTLSNVTTFHRLLRQKMRKPNTEIPSTDHGELA